MRLVPLLIVCVFVYGLVVGTGFRVTRTNADLLATSHDDQAAGLTQMLRFAPADGRPLYYVDFTHIWRSTGFELREVADILYPPGAPRPSLSPSPLASPVPYTPRQTAAAAAWVRQSDLTFSGYWSGVQPENARRTEEVLGFLPRAAGLQLVVGESADEGYSVLKAPVDPQRIAARLTTRGFGVEASGLLGGSTMLSRDPQLDRDALMLLSKNAFLVTPDLVASGPDRESLTRAMVRVGDGGESAADDPGYAQLAAMLEDPAILPGTVLMNATVLGWYPIGISNLMRCSARSVVDALVAGEDLAEQPGGAGSQAEPTSDPLPVYRLIGFGERRGGASADAYWLFAFEYAEPSEAEEAAAILNQRVQGHTIRVGRSGEVIPFVGPVIAEVLPPVIHVAGEVTILGLPMRVAPDSPESLALVYYDGQCGLSFLSPGPL